MLRAARIRVLGALSVAGVVLAVATDSASAGPEPPAPGRSAASSEPYPLSVEVFNAAIRIQELGPELFPGRYGGLSTGRERPEDFLDIYLTEIRDGDARAASDALGVPVEKVRLQRAALTRDAAEAVQMRITDDALAGRLSGVVEVGIDRDVTVTIGLSDSGPERVADVGATYGPGVIVQYGLQATAIAADRAFDSPNWFGGDFLTGGSNGPGCTSSFAVRWPFNGNRYIVTAGHCYALSSNVYNKAAPPINIGSGTYMGSVTNRSWNSGAIDAELIQGPGSRWIWTGGIVPSGTLHIDQVITPWVNMPLCVSGAYDGENCGFTVTDDDIRISLPSGGLLYTLIPEASLAGANVQSLGEGDSGAPVYATIQGVTYGVGVLSAIEPVTYCSNWSVQYPSRRCGSAGYFTVLADILNYFGVVLD